MKCSFVVQLVKNLLAVRETWVQSLGQEDLLEKGMATHSRILPWRSPWAETLVVSNPWGRVESEMTDAT